MYLVTTHYKYVISLSWSKWKRA